MALRDAGGQGDGDPGLDAVHSHPLQVGDNCHRGLDRALMIVFIAELNPDFSSRLIPTPGRTIRHSSV